MEGIVKCKRGVFGLTSWDSLRPPYPPVLSRHQEGPLDDLPSYMNEDTKMTNSINVESVTTDSAPNEGGSNASISEDDLSTEEKEVGPEEADNKQQVLKHMPCEAEDDFFPEPSGAISARQKVPEHTLCEADDDFLPEPTGVISALQMKAEGTKPERPSEPESPGLTGACDEELLWIDSRPADKVDTMQRRAAGFPDVSDDVMIVQMHQETQPSLPQDENKDTIPTPRADKRYLCKLCHERMIGHGVFMQHVQSDVHKARVTAYWRKECSAM